MTRGSCLSFFSRAPLHCQVRASVSQHGGILLLYDARCPDYADDGLKWRKGKMSVKQILFDERDSSYRLKNHKQDKGVSVMRRQTWIEEGNQDNGLRKHEYRLVNREIFFQPESDGSLSRNEGASLQSFPVLLHYFSRDGGASGGAASAPGARTRPGRTRKPTKRSRRMSLGDGDEDDDDDDGDIDELLDKDDEEYADDEVALPRQRAQEEEEEEQVLVSTAASFARKRPSPPPPLPSSSGLPSASKARKGPVDPADFPDMDMEDDQQYIFFGGTLWHNAPDHNKRQRTQVLTMSDDHVAPLDLLRASLGAEQWNDMPVFVEAASGVNILSPHTSCIVDAVAPDCASRPTRVLVVVNGFRSPDAADYDYSCSFADLEVPATLVADGVLSFQSPPHQPGVVTFWVSRRHRTTQLVQYTANVPFYFLPAPRGDGRLSLAYNHLRTFPPEWCERFSDCTRELDLSFNALSDCEFVAHFPLLESLIMDNNLISSSTVFPVLPSLRQLSLNRNTVRQLAPLLDNVRRAFPNLRELSLLGNEACPIFSADDKYAEYRRVCAAQLPHLKLLDSKPVSK